MGLLDKMFGKDDENKPPANFSDVQSGASSTAPAAPAVPVTPSPMGGVTSGGSAAAGAPAHPAAQTYTVKSGDSLSKIAKHHYGDAEAWHRIFEANRDTIKNADLIHPGQVLRLP